MKSAPAPAFSAAAFFAGRTEGRGTLKAILSSRKLVKVHGTGRIANDGSLILDQSVEEAGKPPKQREWRIHTVATGGYVGTLTDADGPVTGSVSGNSLHLRFRMKGGFHVDQWLMLEPGARVVHNEMVVRKFGVVVARLNETIRKLDA